VAGFAPATLPPLEARSRLRLSAGPLSG